MMTALPRPASKILIAIFALLLVQPAIAGRHKKKDAPKPKSIYEIDTLISPVPRQRQLWHDYFHKALRGADASDGKVDGYIWYGDDTMASNAITQAMMHKAAHLDTMIENLPFTDKQLEHNEKVRYLRAITDMVKAYNRDTKADPFFYRKVVNNMHDLIIARHEGKLDEFVRANTNEYTLANAELLDGHPELTALLYRKVGQEEPLKMIKRLHEFAREPFACDIIAAAARKAPNEVYNYASSTNATLNGAVRRCKDPLVQAIVRITSESKSPLKAMSFISDIYNNRLSIADVDKITADETSLFKNLVRLKMQGDTLGGTTYSDELAYRANRIYISRINELHESPDAVRFKILDGLTPEELYFIIVYGQDRIYTSSFIGAFRRMMERLKPSSGDELLDKVRYEHFRTFIRMCAGYNTLSDFLSTMKPEEKTAVMKEFISGLEYGKTDELEDAVDVADAFGSIKDSALTEFLRQEIISNYTRVSEARNLKGTIVYGLLATLANGADNDSLAENLHLPPIGRIPYRNLVNDSGIVYEQFFFYGDEDGRNSYVSFLGSFTDTKKWSRPQEDPTKQWVTIKSISGKPIVIFANLPLDYESGKDDEAQKALAAYMTTRDIHPTFLVHRGHSYHLNSTVDYMSKSNRIIMLGSCGGYHNLGAVLDHSPDAHLISTKQTGTMLVNDAIIKTLNDHLLAGDDIDWVNIWAEIGQSLRGKEKDFNEYVPPYRNLGAIFIKAYRRIFNEADLAGS
jgi:hypothetical protein